jgi:hypothetical protein
MGMNVYLVGGNVGKIPFLNKTMICSVMLFRYFTCLIEMPTGIFFLFAITIG